MQLVARPQAAAGQGLSQLPAQDAPDTQSVSVLSLYSTESQAPVCYRLSASEGGLIDEDRACDMCLQVLAEQQASAQLAAVLLKGISNITSALAESYSEAASAKANTTALAEKQVSYSFTVRSLLGHEHMGMALVWQYIRVLHACMHPLACLAGR